MLADGGRSAGWAHTLPVADQGTFGASGWGYKAQEVLGRVKGRDFRHEKTKKKRGSYRGGKIDMHQVNSIRFDDSDDE